MIGDRRRLVERTDRKTDPDQWSTTDQAAGFFLLGLMYALVLCGSAFSFAGGGHGPAFFLDVSMPGLVLWPAAALASVFGNRPIGRWICPTIVFVQYFLCLDTMALTAAQSRDDVERFWARYPGEVLFFVAFFVAGQAAIWIVYAVKRRGTRIALSKRRITLGEAMMAIVVAALLLAMVVIPARWILARV